MLVLPNGTRIVEHESELPHLSGEELFGDFETTTGDRKVKAVNPWHDCYVAGIAVTSDREPGAWYVPVGHHHGRNIDINVVQDWWDELLCSHKRWVNHNIKFDVHVGYNALGVLPPPGLELVCTLTQSKIVDTDRIYKGGYGLDAVALDWLNEDISQYYERLHEFLGDSKDYADAPIDVLGEYAGQDVMTNRRLWRHIKHVMPEQCKRVAATEVRLTSILCEAERRGLRIDVQQVQLEQFRVMGRMLELEEECCRIAQFNFRPHVNQDCYEVLCGRYGMPVLGWTEGDEDDDEEHRGNPSFDKDTLMLYRGVPNAPLHLIDLMAEFRKLNTYNSLFLKVFLNEHVNGVLHPDHNQIVRTGRMSCKKPNSQQFNPWAKKLILPHLGRWFLCADASQIEFRTITHYIQDHRMIEAYNHDPWTDYHDWVSELCEMRRKPAKNMNFMMAFGGGRKKALKMLRASDDVAPVIQAEVRRQLDAGQIDEDQAKVLFEAMAEKRANTIYDTYHRRIPGIKRTSRSATKAAEERGFVFNLAGRRRHLARRQAHIAFNTLNQSSASDIVKEAMVRVHGEVEELDICTMVHDELVLEGDADAVQDPAVQRKLLGILEEPEIELRVPLRWEYNYSPTSWHAASEDKMKTGYFHGTADRGHH